MATQRAERGTDLLVGLDVGGSYVKATAVHPERGVVATLPVTEEIHLGVLSLFLWKRESPPSIMVTRKPKTSLSEILRQGTGCVKGRF